MKYKVLSNILETSVKIRTAEHNFATQKEDMNNLILIGHSEEK